ncbi:MAG: hypothetical protein JHC93_03590 [Parachlamydiales bacterium]|nr:hypothetical protein [Parachlamydiales bacterium]
MASRISEKKIGEKTCDNHSNSKSWKSLQTIFENIVGQTDPILDLLLDKNLLLKVNLTLHSIFTLEFENPLL